MSDRFLLPLSDVGAADLGLGRGWFRPLMQQPQTRAKDQLWPPLFAQEAELSTVHDTELGTFWVLAGCRHGDTEHVEWE